MFTGLVEALGTVKDIRREGAGSRLLVAEPNIAPELTIGESVAINGCCLTVVKHDDQSFAFEAGPETLEKTNLGELTISHRVNLERSMRMGDRLGGHWVQGHVDGIARISKRKTEGEWEFVWFECPEALALQMVSKGSIAVDGISLTLVEVGRREFSVALIPHTLAVTTLGFKQVGDTVNLETDILAKYVQKYMQHQ